ncbi:MAG TPA: hypothetical protein VK324_00860 [Tepidisphaeraceae bacterium]|nr:hypothetical protein [Tepidisphaeraceae bacterium]
MWPSLPGAGHALDEVADVGALAGDLARRVTAAVCRPAADT